MKINLSKNNIVAISTLAIIAIAILVLAAVNADNGDKTKAEAKRLRRSQVSTTSKQVATTQSSTTKVVPSSSIVVPSVAFIPGATYQDVATLKVKWDGTSFCSMLPAAIASDILDMTTDPSGQYFASDSEGLKCTYSDGEGNEVFLQVSASTYANARTVDVALGATTLDVQLENTVYGVAKSSKVDGYTLSLNVYGDTQNEVLINAPNEKAGKKVAVIVTNNLKVHG